MGVGSLREVGGEGAGGGISKGGGNREKWEKFRNIGTTFRNRKSTQGREVLRKGAGTGSVGCGMREVQTPLSPPHLRGRVSLIRLVVQSFNCCCSWLWKVMKTTSVVPLSLTL